MKSRSNINRFLIYIFLFIPLILVILEFSFGFLNNLKSNKFSSSKIPSQKYDAINGWRRQKMNSDVKNSFIDRHGLIKTPFESNNSADSEILGILITGNSVVMGVPVLYKDYKATFVSKLETSLRNYDDRVDIINLANNGYNSWQEGVELFRYLNSYPINDDLPEPKMFASIGGIQDLWDFLDVINKKNEPMNEYYKANGLMTWNFRNNEYLENISKSQDGNLKSAFKLFYSSLVNKIRRDSNLFLYVQTFKNNFFKRNISKIESKKKSLPNLYSENYSLLNLLEDKLKISFSEYKNKRDYVISSKIRNLKLIKNLNPKNNSLYIYLPSLINVNKNSDTRVFGFQEIDKLDLTLKDLKILEADYRKVLFEKISYIDGIEEYDLSGFGELSWFHDISHFSITGQNQLHKILLSIFDQNLFSNKLK